MRFLSTMLLSTMVLAAIAGPGPTATAGEQDTYIFDALSRASYRLSFGRLIHGKPVPDWVKAVLVSGEGVSVPAKTIAVGTKTYRLDHVCKVHDCAGHTLDVLWSNGGNRIWAVIRDGGEPIVLGNPGPEQQKILDDAAKPAG